jgi:hypothetical protein
MKETNLNFGDIVIVSGRLRRHETWGAGPRRKQWKRDHWDGRTRKGIYIGKRTLANGKAEFEYEAGVLFVPEEYISAALVVFNERENPVYVDFEDLEKIEIAQRCTVHSVRTGKQCLNKAADTDIASIFNDGLVTCEEQK